MIQTLVSTPKWRLSRMGGSLVINFHGRFAALFQPLVWEYTHPSDREILMQDAECLVNGYYGRLLTHSAKKQVESIPMINAI